MPQNVKTVISAIAAARTSHNHPAVFSDGTMLEVREGPLVSLLNVLYLYLYLYYIYTKTNTNTNRRTMEDTMQWPQGIFAQWSEWRAGKTLMFLTTGLTT